MRLEAVLLDKIEAYLTGRLAPQEAADLERQAAADPELAATIELVRLEMDGMELILEQDLRAGMAAWEAERAVPAMTARANPYSRYWRMAAAVALLITAGGGVWWLTRPAPAIAPVVQHEGGAILPDTSTVKQQTPDNQRDIVEKPVLPDQQQPSSRPNRRYIAMATSAYDRPVFSDHLMRGDETPGDVPKSLLQQAEEAYAARDYRKVVRLLADTSGAFRQQILYLRGHANFQLEKFSAAAADFQVLAAEDAEQKDDAQWFRALSLLAQKGPDDAEVLQLLRKIAGDNGHKRSEKARSLLLTIQSR